MTIATVDLRAEAAAETRRLAAARALLREGDEQALGLLEGGAAWIARPRRSGLRRALGQRVCLVWRVAFEDAYGRFVESRLVPVLVETAPGGGRVLLDPANPDSIRSFIQHAQTLSRPHVEAVCEAWAAAVMQTTQAFTSTRLSRELATNRPAPAAAHASQSGLFDRRADRSRAARAADAAELECAAAERRDDIAASGAIARRPARLLLILVP